MSKISTLRNVSLREIEFFELKIEHLRENEFLRETILNCLLGAQMGWINEIKNAKKSRDTANLSERKVTDLR